MSISEALEAKRLELNKKGYQFAEMLGIKKSHYSEIINGKRDLPKDAMKKAFHLGIPAEVLFQ